MELFGRIIFMGGVLLLLIFNFYIIVKAFMYKITQGLLCLFIPAYIFYYALRKETRQTNALIVNFLGMIMLIIGAVMLSF